MLAFYSRKKLHLITVICSLCAIILQKIAVLEFVDELYLNANAVTDRYVSQSVTNYAMLMLIFQSHQRVVEEFGLSRK